MAETNLEELYRKTLELILVYAEDKESSLDKLPIAETIKDVLIKRKSN